MDIRTDAKGNPILDQLSKDGFVDLTFRIRDLTARGKHYRFHLSASHKHRVVGVDIDVVKGIKSGLSAKMERVQKHGYRSGVRFRRSGVESDRLVAAIGELYGVKRPPRKMVEEETFTAIALHQGKL